MKRLTQNEFDQSTLEAMMERYRAELLRYQRATPPGRPTLEQNLKTAVLKNEEQPPEQDDIWEQPAIFAAERPKDTEQEETQQPAPLLLPEPAPPPEPVPERDIEPTLPQNISFDCYEFEKCIGAYGSFVPYEQAKSCCKAEIFNRPTDVMVKFAADIPPGAAESSRCRKSFWVRFFCGDKLYDLPASLLSAEVVDDALLSQAFSKSFSADPKTGLRDKANFWRVVTANPRSLSMAVRLYSDMGTIGSYRMADGFCHPMIWQNANGEQKLVKPRWLSAHRPRTLSRFEAEELAASDPDALSRDLVMAIKGGEKPQFELAAQMMDYPPPTDLSFEPLSPDIDWPEHSYPLQKLGMLTLERLPRHFADEIAAAKPDAKNIIDGITHAPFRYGDPVQPAADHLLSLGELFRKTLASNLADDLRRLPADLLEEVLMLFTKADLSFGRMLTALLGGI